MKNLLTTLLAALSLCLTSTAQEISLFNGRDLSGWTVRTGDAGFLVRDGCIVGKNKRQVKGMHTFLTTNAEFDDFILTFEYMADANVNSGVQFRSQFHDTETRYVARGRTIIRPKDRVYGYQFEIDSRGARNNAAVYDEGRRGEFLDDLGSNPAAQKAYVQGGWNQARIECIGDSIKTFLNGVPAASIQDGMTRKGVIALQVHATNPPGAEMRWRNIRLKPVSAQPGRALLPAASPAMVQTDPSQPRIEVIKDQGPNAVEWALTPLDEAIPADIRQNLTFLREDLLDEAAKASPEAYKLASDYCDKLLAALDQRELARVNAGYAAAQADAAKKTSTQALDARRNHQMSWPQFSREESQRAALRENEASKADVKKQRLKVEWAGRSMQMRAYLDSLYSQLREAMRG